MIVSKPLSAIVILGQVLLVQAQECDVKWTCHPVTTGPTLDADLSDWSGVEAASNNLTGALTKVYYAEGLFRCVYDNERIYMALEIPGRYRFDPDSNKRCASIGTMMKLGSKATYLNMGDCPEAATECPADGSLGDTCKDYLVDLGAHWELRTTEQGVAYPANLTGGTGNNLLANLDDEYALSPFCRPDDDEPGAGNEWAGAWRHTNPTEGEDGTYIFELSRLLTSQSTVTDGQFVPGESYSFGYAFWDPYEHLENGWTDAGHYVTGCAENWATLELKPIQECDVKWTCYPVSTSPTLDADLADWSGVVGTPEKLSGALTGTDYVHGAGTLRCVYDEERIYFALEVPGDYRFDPENNKKCASIGTMMKLGSKATYLNMGGCPEAAAGCPDDGSLGDTCKDYMVDLGAHWELRTTEQGVMYPVNLTSGTGNDLAANKDDEYAISPFCRPDDDEPGAGNEWAGAWRHTNPTEGEFGTYIFELSRLLTSQSSITDGQFVAGETYSFGYAFWDPFENPDNGWTDAGHYVTGCSSNWANLELKVEDDGGATSVAPSPAPPSTSGAPSIVISAGGALWAMVAAALVVM